MVCTKSDADNHKKKEKGTSETIRLWRNHRTAKYNMHNTNHVIIEASVYNSRDKPVNMEVKKNPHLYLIMQTKIYRASLCPIITFNQPIIHHQTFISNIKNTFLFYIIINQSQS